MMPRSAQLKTTLYLPIELAKALKALASAAGETVNATVLRALAAYVSGTSKAGAEAADGSDLREELARLVVRVEALEQKSSIAQTGGGVEERRTIDAPGVRREARDIIRRLGRPVPHGELKSLLEQKYVLPGRRPTENLRTILVHPKARGGFVLLPKQGYAIDENVE